MKVTTVGERIRGYLSSVPSTKYSNNSPTEASCVHLFALIHM